MILVKEKQGGLIPAGLKRWPFKCIEHFADTTRVSPSPAGPAGRCPLNFLNLINLKFRVRAPNLVKAKPKVCMQLPAKAKFLRRKPSVLVALVEISEMSILSVMVIPMYYAD